MKWSFQVEAKPGEWVSVPNEFRGDRSYSLFAWLGAPPKRGFNTIVPVHKLRGLPKDISPDEEELYGEHSYSWLTSEEILPLRGQMELKTMMILITSLLNL